jgi:predicted transposase YbfD/YdcC
MGLYELNHFAFIHYRRVISRIAPEHFQACFLGWVEEAVGALGGDFVAIDGKTLRGSYEDGDPKAVIHMVSAWASENEMVLAQRKTDEKSNEITAIPELLKLLDLEGCIVTIDAMGCQTEIAGQIREAEADYLLALKGNQGGLHTEAREYFEEGKKRRQFEAMPVSKVEQTEISHTARRCVAATSQRTWSGYRASKNGPV